MCVFERERETDRQRERERKREKEREGERERERESREGKVRETDNGKGGARALLRHAQQLKVGHRSGNDLAKFSPRSTKVLHVWC